MHIAEKVFAAFAVLLAAIALTAFWPPANLAIITWLIFWCGLCLLTAYAIVRRARYATIGVWAINAVALLSAIAALRDGMLQGIGIIIDVALFIPMIWFSVWYQRRRHAGG